MLKREDIQNIANLSRIELTEDEMNSLPGEIEAILSYVGKIDEAVGKVEVEHSHRNETRPDEITNTAGSHTKELLEVAPLAKDGFVEVKKVLS